MARWKISLVGLVAAVVTLVGASSALAAVGDISTVAGNGTTCSTASTTGCDDGGATTSAELNSPQGISPLPGGGFLVADADDNEIDQVSATGMITIVAGDGSTCSNNQATTDPCGDNGPATSAQLDGPRDVLALPHGGFLIADFFDDRVREVSSTGVITTIAGDGNSGDTGDNGPATAAELDLPRSLSYLPDGALLIADHANCVIREVSTTGTITTVAGTGTCGYTGDGGLATSAELDNTTDVAALPTGAFILSDSPDDVIREVSPAGIINIVAGVKDVRGDTGNGGTASSAEIDQPRGMAVLANGGFVFAEEGGNQIRMVSPAGTISTIAGNGTPGFMGDGGLATAAELDGPEGVSLAPNGGLLIADTLNERIRYVAGGPPTATISGPAAGALGFVYLKGAVVATTFGCTENIFGLGLSSCDDNDGRATPAGGSGRLNTNSLGSFTYTVTATSLDGQTGSASIAYRVVAPQQTTIATKKSARVRHGKVSITLGCSYTIPINCQGTLLITAKQKLRHHHTKTITVAKHSYLVKGHSGTFTLTLSKAAKKLLAAAHKHHLSVTVEAKQTGAQPVSHVITLTG